MRYLKINLSCHDNELIIWRELFRKRLIKFSEYWLTCNVCNEGYLNNGNNVTEWEKFGFEGLKIVSDYELHYLGVMYKIYRVESVTLCLAFVFRVYFALSYRKKRGKSLLSDTFLIRISRKRMRKVLHYSARNFSQDNSLNYLRF